MKAKSVAGRARNPRQHRTRNRTKRPTQAATPRSLMRLKVLLPFQVFVDEDDVSRIVAESTHGAFGLLPHRLDCVAALAPGILIYETPAHGEVCLAVDEGMLVKTGSSVLVSVRRALRGEGLALCAKRSRSSFWRRTRKRKAFDRPWRKWRAAFCDASRVSNMR